MSSPTNGSAPTALYNPEVEANSLANLLKHGGEVWAEYHLNDRLDYSVAHRPLWDIVKAQLDQTPPGSLDPLLLSTKLAGIGITSLEGGFAVFEYLDGLRTRYVDKEQASSYARELKRMRVRRDLITKLDTARRELVGKPNATFEEMTGLVERGLTAVTTEYYATEEYSNVFGEDFARVMEDTAANPVDASEMGWMGPFASINRSLGALTGPGLMTTIGARTGNQKSALGFFYHVYLAERYNIPVLLLDCGEMTKRRIQDRAACALSMGRIPLWAVKSGEWADNKEWARIMREDCIPRAAKLRIDYINIGHMTPREKLSCVRRYYYQKVGRGNPMAILDDYLKGVEALGKNSAEHQAVGYYVNDIKNLITNEIPASFWTSVQNNRSGVHQGKKANELVESEDQMGLSDRIIQQSDWGFILRFKVPEETGRERDLFGNMKLAPVKTREALGKDYEKALRPVKLPSGRFVSSYFNLESRTFSFTDKGDLRMMLEVLGQSAVDLSQPAQSGSGSSAVQPL